MGLDSFIIDSISHNGFARRKQLLRAFLPTPEEEDRPLRRAAAGSLADEYRSRSNNMSSYFRCTDD